MTLRMSNESNVRCRKCTVYTDQSCYTFGFKAFDVCYDKVRAYRELTKERIVELSKAIYQANTESEIARTTKYREDHREYLHDKISCPICQCQVIRRDLARHQRTKKCMKAKEQQAQG